MEETKDEMELRLLNDSCEVLETAIQLLREAIKRELSDSDLEGWSDQFLVKKRDR